MPYGGGGAGEGGGGALAGASSRDNIVADVRAGVVLGTYNVTQSPTQKKQSPLSHTLLTLSTSHHPIVTSEGVTPSGSWSR